MDDSSEQSLITSPKYCWICFSTETYDYSVCWLSPCRCSGTTKWVHEECLQRWIDEQQQEQDENPISCPQCHTEYIIVFPKQSSLFHLLDNMKHVLNFSCSMLTCGILVGSVYWSLTTHGALTIMQILGYKDGLNVIQETNPIFLLASLPIIPFILVLGRMIKWDEALLKFWRKHSDISSNIPRLPIERRASLTRLVCGGLMLPTIATIVGKLLFQHIDSNIQRTVLGGITFIFLKGILKIFYKQNQYVRWAHRKIANYDSQSSSSTTIE